MNEHWFIYNLFKRIIEDQQEKNIPKKERKRLKKERKEEYENDQALRGMNREFGGI